ncbi:MAG: endonuclease [Flavobacteriaceae bacterium]|nr:endonuclease [Flavobacteriaceae bacterium]|tara:strand:- start:37811 stop:38821 length:1011 start_codon:yes stop_codon:yes gene_type:complete
MKKLSLINKLLYFINTIVALLLLFSFFIPELSPKIFPFFSIFALFVPFLILVNIAFFLYWLVVLKKQLLLSFSILSVSWIFLTTLFMLSSKEEMNEDSIKVMSYNVKLFNHYQWIKEKDIPEKISSLIKESNPDVLAIQEYSKKEAVNFDYEHKFIKTKGSNDKFGMAIFSKFPILKTGSLQLENTSNNIIFADLLIKNDTVRLYNYHLQSLRINPEEENFGEKDSKKLVENLNTKFKEQAYQAEKFLVHENDWKGKILVCGDLNNTAYSWVYDKMRGDKKDAFLEAGNGFGKSYDYFFPLRIDFIFSDAKSEVKHFEVIDQKLSDHYPIVAEISW